MLGRTGWMVMCTLLLSLSPLGVSTAIALTLEEAVQLALENDAQYRAETFGAQAQYADGLETVAGYGPQLSVSGSYQQSNDRLFPDENSDLEATSADFKERVVTASFRQPVVDAELASASYRGIKEMKVARLQEKKAREELLLRVHERYYGVLSAQEKLTIATSEKEALYQQVQNAKDRIALDFGTITDQYDAEARYRNALAAEIGDRTEFENRKQALAETIGQSFTPLVDTESDNSVPLLTYDLEYWQKTASEKNTDLAIRSLQYEAASLVYKEKQSRFFPALTFFADYSERDSEDGLAGYGEERRETDVGLRLELDLLSGGADTAATVAALKRKLEARERVNAAKQSLYRSVTSLWTSITDTVALLEAYDLAVEANGKRLEATRDSYREGVKTLLDVLNAQQEYYRALGQYKTTRYDYLVLLERFRQVVGSIGDEISS